MTHRINATNIAILTGAGVSAESGLRTFRDGDGLWREHSVYEVASPQAWAASPQLVLDFYNERRALVAAALPNAAHLAIAKLEQRFNVTVITQNVDDLHERAGSRNVLHLHGRLTQARSTADPALIYDIAARPIRLGDYCDKGSQLRPHIVWFGEYVLNLDAAAHAVAQAGKVLVIGTSLTVYPAAGLLDLAAPDAEKVIVTPELDHPPRGYQWLQGKAAEVVPGVVEGWIGPSSTVR